MNTFLQLIGWRESPSATRLFASRWTTVVVVAFVVLTVGLFRLLGLT